MRTATVLAAALAALTLTACQTTDGGGAAARPAGQADAAAQTGAPPTAEGVTVMGHGRVTGEPDTLRATVGVHVARPDVDTALRDANAAAEAVLAALREHGVADEDIQTREFGVHPEHRHRPDAPPEVTGYAVRNLVEVALRDVEAAGAVLAAAVQAGGDDARVEHVRFSLEDNTAQLEAAREAAFEDAQARAEDYARLAGRSLGALVSVSELVGQTPPPAPTAMSDVAVDERAAVPIEPGQQEVGVRIQAVWALE